MSTSARRSRKIVWDGSRGSYVEREGISNAFSPCNHYMKSRATEELMTLPRAHRASVNPRSERKGVFDEGFSFVDLGLDSSQ
jgi:hypothetical protein